ncbi:unnamed protein product [Lepidochelys olivacea]
MNHTSEANMKKISVANLDKLLDDFSQIEKKICEIDGKNSLLDLQLEKCNRLLTLSQSKEDSIKEEYATLQNVIKGLRQTIENQCNLRDENERLKNNTRLLEEKLKVHEQEYKNQIDKLVTEIKNKEEEYKMELTKVHCDMSRKFELKEEEHKEKLEKKELTILDLTRQLRTLDKEKQNEIIKLQIEFNAKLARVQNKTTKSYPDTTVLPQNIYRRKQRSVPMLEEKLAVLDLLRDGMLVSNVAHKYGRNKSSIRAIKIREREICQAVVSSAPVTAKVMSQVRDKTSVKTEKALNLWLEDMNRKPVPIDGNMLREKALSLYALFIPPNKEGQPSDEKEFKASQGWLNSFRNRFNLKNVQTTGEAASANEEAAKAYPEQLKKITEEKGFLPKQVFNADETGPWLQSS